MRLIRITTWSFVGLLVATIFASGAWAGKSASPAGERLLPPGTAGLQGGVKVAPSWIAADRTPFAVALSIRGLRGSARYSVKIRLRRASGQQFGSTWNAAMRRWCSASAAWSSQPTVTTGPDGAISAWLMTRAGSRSGAAPECTATVSTVLRAEGATSNVEPPVKAETAIDASRAGGRVGWLHGSLPATDSALATGMAGRVFPILVRDTLLGIAGATLAEPNGVDDDDNHVVDDESPLQSGPGRAFRLAVPAARLLAIGDIAGTRWPNQVTFGGLDLPAPRRGATRAISLAALPRRAVWSRRVTFSVILAGSTAETVTIQRSCDGFAWSTICDMRLGENGSGSVECTVARSASYRTVWLGTPSCPPSVSRRVFVTVLPVMSARALPERVYVDSPVRVTGIFRPGQDPREVVVDLRNASGQVVQATRAVVSNGSFACVLRPLQVGRFEVKVTFPGDRELCRRCVSAGWIVVLERMQQSRRAPRRHPVDCRGPVSQSLAWHVMRG